MLVIPVRVICQNISCKVPVLDDIRILETMVLELVAEVCISRSRLDFGLQPRNNFVILISLGKVLSLRRVLDGIRIGDRILR